MPHHTAHAAFLTQLLDVPSGAPPAVVTAALEALSHVEPRVPRYLRELAVLAPSRR
ncbi:MAG: hypothetical protein JO037_16040 [Actinobacteria bacterium]|nr:hypothetical protein [Actinomycetota bacterium]